MANQRVASQNKPSFLQMTADQIPRNLVNNNYMDSNGSVGSGNMPPQFVLP